MYAQHLGRWSLSQRQQLGGTALALDQRDADGSGPGGDDNNLPGEFDDDEPDDLLTHVQRSESSLPSTQRALRVPHNTRVEDEGRSSARSTEQVRHFSFSGRPLT